MIRRIRRWECVRTSRYTTTGRSGLGLLHGTTRYVLGIGLTLQRVPPEPAAGRTKWARSCRTTNSLRRDYGPADPRDIFHPAHIGTGPWARSSATRPAALRGIGPEQRLGVLEDSEAGGLSGATGRDLICIGSMQTYYSRDWDLEPVRELVAFEMLQRAIFNCCRYDRRQNA